jgi:hypothetical protein
VIPPQGALYNKIVKSKLSSNVKTRIRKKYPTGGGRNQKKHTPPLPPPPSSFSLSLGLHEKHLENVVKVPLPQQQQEQQQEQQQQQPPPPLSSSSMGGTNFSFLF